jgi:CubicO group peptidase (beta-lactamase class C family)
MTVEGRVESGWEGVRDAFEANFAAGEEVGAGVAVYHRGREVVDLRGGHFDRARTQPYAADTLQLIFSTTKGVTAIALAMCVQRGLLDYGERVSTYWPEFAAHGKGEVTVAQLLSHQVGLISVDAPTTLAEALDWDTTVARLADTKPDWPIGTAHGYHALTFGWLAGELIRRVDGRSPGRFVADEIAGPLGLDLWIGLPEELEPRVSPMIGSIVARSSDPAAQALIDQFAGPATRLGRALTLSGAFSGNGVFNRRDVHAAELPAANGISTARSLARLYASTMAPIDGVRLLDQATRDLARTTVTPPGEHDMCLVLPSTFGMGFMTHGDMTPYSGPGSYGHAGAGGSVAYAQPERELAFAYVMNQMARNIAGDRRAQRLIDAAAKAADAAS